MNPFHPPASGPECSGSPEEDEKGSMRRKNGPAAEIEELARERLGFERLRPGQLDAVQALAGGRDVLAVLPTGSGKSAIYELAGLLRAGPTVVVSPLIALEDDQLGGGGFG